MIAEEPQISNSTVEEIPLFAGLSFPVVPTAPVSNKETKDVELKPLSTKIITPLTEIENIEEILANETDCLLQKDEVQNIASSSVKPPRNPNSLSVLYSQETTVEESENHEKYYPEIPQVKPTKFLPPRSTQIAPPTSSSSSTFIGSDNIIHNQAMERHINPGLRSESELVNELLQENSRLSEEVQRLKRMVDTQTQVHINQSAISNIQDNSQVSSASATHQGTESGNQTQSQITNMNPQEGVKYVCCGGCGQWLVAPKEAQFVACSSCNAVNNCNLSPQNQNAQLDSRALQHHRPFDNPFSWMFECFSRTFNN